MQKFHSNNISISTAYKVNKNQRIRTKYMHMSHHYLLLIESRLILNFKL